VTFSIEKHNWLLKTFLATICDSLTWLFQGRNGSLSPVTLQSQNQRPQGNGTLLSAADPARFPPELLEQARRATAVADRSLSSRIRLAVKHELRWNVKCG
jgi:hypothetical protein